MGKGLIIKGADFHVNAIENVNNITEITSNAKISGLHRQFINYPSGGNDNQFMYAANALANKRIFTLDVSSYVGRTIILYSAQLFDPSSYIGGLWYACFASSVSVALPWTGTSAVQNAVTPVAMIDGKGNGEMETYTLVVPQGANYLVITDNSNYPTKVYLVNQ